MVPYCFSRSNLASSPGFMQAGRLLPERLQHCIGSSNFLRQTEHLRSVISSTFPVVLCENDSYEIPVQKGSRSKLGVLTSVPGPSSSRRRIPRAAKRCVTAQIAAVERVP
jgi:hypothetical protein